MTDAWTLPPFFRGMRAKISGKGKENGKTKENKGKEKKGKEGKEGEEGEEERGVSAEG